jgi:hypothetical protein
MGERRSLKQKRRAGEAEALEKGAPELVVFSYDSFD